MHSTHVVCPHCNATNRIPADRLNQNPRCGKCRGSIFTGDYAAKGVTELGIDLITLDADFGVSGRPLTLIGHSLGGILRPWRYRNCMVSFRLIFGALALCLTILPASASPWRTGCCGGGVRSWCSSATGRVPGRPGRRDLIRFCTCFTEW